MRQIRRTLAAVMIFATAGCGSSPSEPGPYTQQVSNTVPASSVSLGLIGLYQFDLNIPRSGTATLRLTWPNAIVDLDLYLTTSSCGSGTSLLNGGCTVLASSIGSSGTSEVIARTVANGETYRFWVVNYSSVAQSFTVDLEIK